MQVTVRVMVGRCKAICFFLLIGCIGSFGAKAGDKDRVPELFCEMAPSAGPLHYAERGNLEVTAFIPAVPDLPNKKMADAIQNALTAYAQTRQTHRPQQLYDQSEIKALMRRVNECLYTAGYPTSGVEQIKIDNRTAIYQIRVGRVDDVSLIAVDRRTGELLPDFVLRWLRRMLLPDGSQPFDINALQLHMKTVMATGFVGRPSIDVVPGDHPGTARLMLETERPAQTPSIAVAVTNDLPKAIGSTVVQTTASIPGFTPGFDEFTTTAARGSGFSRIGVGYAGPFIREEHRWSMMLSQSQSKFVEDYFSDLDIKSKSLELDIKANLKLIDDWYNVEAANPGKESTLWHRSLSLLVGLHENRTRTFLLGEPFSFDKVARNGWIDLLETSLGIEARQEGHDNGIDLYIGIRHGMRGIFSHFSDDIGYGKHSIIETSFDATQNLPWWNSQLRFRTRGQWSADRVVPAGRFVLGGSGSIRGIDAGALSGNSGHSETLEFTLPILSNETIEIDGLLFIDSGALRAVDGIRQKINTSGFGFNLKINQQLNANFLISHKLSGSNDIPMIGGHAIKGISFSIFTKF